MARAILATRDYIFSQLEKGQILMDEDPFVFKRVPGAYITAQSAFPNSLTWSALSIAMDGLYQALYERRRFNQAKFDITEKSLNIQVGTGKLISENWVSGSVRP